MAIQKLQDQSKTLADLIVVYTSLAKRYAADIDKQSDQDLLRMKIEEKRQHRFDGGIDIVLGMATVAATFFGGPLGYAIATSITSVYKASQIDGSFKDKVANTLLVATTSQLSSYIQSKTINSDILNFSMRTTYDKKTGHYVNNYNPSNAATSQYKAQNAVNSFLSTMIKKGDQKAIQATTVKEKVSYLEAYQNLYAEYALEQAILMITVRIVQLENILDNQASYQSHLRYSSLANLVSGVQIASRHLGSSIRDVYKRFYTDQDQLSHMSDDRQGSLTIRNELLTKVTNSEVFAKDTDYGRAYKRIELLQQQRDTQVDFTVYAMGEHRLALNREAFFNLIDTRILLWSYFNDYCQYFDKKLGRDVKEYFKQSLPDRCQGHWSDTFNNAYRMRDLSMIYLLKSTPELILGESLYGKSLMGGNIKLQVNDYLSALYVAISSACYFYLEFYAVHESKVGRANLSHQVVDQAIDLVFLFLNQIKESIGAPLKQVEFSSGLHPGDLNKLAYYGVSSDTLAKEHNTFLDDRNFYDTSRDYDIRVVNALREFTEQSLPLDNAILPEIKNYIHQQVVVRQKQFLESYIQNGQPIEIKEPLVNKFIKPTTNVQFTRVGSTEFKGFQEIYADYQSKYQLPSAAMSLERLYAQKPAADYTNAYGEGYLSGSIADINTQISLPSMTPSRANQVARYAALKRSFVKQRLSLHAYYNEKGNLQEVLESIEEIMMILTAELFTKNHKQ